MMGTGLGRNLGLIMALLLLVLVGSITGGERFFDFNNFLTLVRFASIIGVLSIGMTFVIIGGGIDLSVGSVLGLASVVATLAAVQTFAAETSWIVMVLIAIAVGALAGFVNGIVISYGKVVAFMATLAMLVAARGLAEILSERRSLIVRDNNFVEVIGRGEFLFIPSLVWIFIIVAAVGWVLLNKTTFGRRTVAIGGNREAARLAGINVKRHTVYLYVLAGLAAGIGAVMILGRTTAGVSTHGQLYELDAIAAVVVGGTLLAGGRGTIIGTVLGVLIFATLTNIFTINNLDTSLQAVVKGVIIVLAVMLQQAVADRGSARKR
ncbi:ABC transporter permease [Leifsonia sp. AK011]|uniref:ABC transporter permease n=1 Tax=Leifsonia sp. AK011 TaxID=2723075 RepID=UPI0015CB378E|nr:ABC transporter permease [Leifsonia sp. AK011]